MYKMYVKRILDIVISLIALILLMPLMIVLYILVRVKLGNPAIFKQKRPGKNEKIFKLYKFRTMTNEKDDKGNLLPDEKRLTKFGKLLRSTSLDEIPELINILKGDMSIVGPRPQLIKDMVFMDKMQRQRHTVRQGLTGLAQVNGRNNITWEKKLKIDLEYIENITFLNDCKIVFKTIANVLCKKDINTQGMETAEDYGDYLLNTGKITKEYYEQMIQKAKDIMMKNL